MAETTSKNGEPQEPVKVIKRRRYFTRRNTFIAAVLLSVLLLLIALVGVITYRYGVYDNYIKAQFVAKMDNMGMTFTADVFRLTVNPFELELKNARFKDKLTGADLFFIRDAHLAMTVSNLYAWQLSRDISIDTTEVNGAEVWVAFDENGRSNFANLHFVENEPGTRVNFKYKSVDFKLTDSTVHFGDLSRKISGNARNVLFLLAPADRSVADEQKRYNFDLTSTDSNFVYNQSPIENIDIRLTGIADDFGATITAFDLKTPIGESSMTGTLKDWASPQYDLDIQSKVDREQASGILPIGTSLVGVGNFKGKVTGQGETYKVVGEADSANLRAGGVSLKGINVAGTVAGTNSDYEANGNAVAQLLTFEDFRVDFLKLSGNVRGTGTDFRWLGELQAAAASSRNTSLGGLFLHDAYAENHERELRAGAASGKAQKFSVKDVDFADLNANNIKIQLDGDVITVSAPVARSTGLTSKDYSLKGLTGKDLTVRHHGETTNVDIAGVSADSGEIKNVQAKGVSLGKFSLTDVPATTKIAGQNLRVNELNVAGAQVTNIEAATVDLENAPRGPLNVYSDKVHVASIDSDSAVLGSINVGGVRMTIVQGRVEAKSDDIDAGNVTLKKTTTLKNGGTLEAVKISKSVYILEPSGHYRATADMSLGGGAIGSVALGNATAKVEVTNDRAALNDLTANVMSGKLAGTAVIGGNDQTSSTVNGHFADLDLSKLIALQTGRIIPLEGQTTGNIDLTFNGTNFRTASGTVNADITANAGTTDRGVMPMNGQLDLTATNGLFNVQNANLKTANSSRS